ncbi:MAG: ABC transporter permease [Acidimicrobiia bacterium]
MTPTTVGVEIQPRRRAAIGEGFGAIYVRRLRVATKTVPGLAGQLITPVLWVLVVAPALADALGDFAPGVDYYTYAAVAQIVLLVPFTSMFAGINVLVDKDQGILRDFLVAPIRRPTIPLANALGVLTISWVQVATIIALAVASGAEVNVTPARSVWLVIAVTTLGLGTYGLAEALAYRVGRQEAYGPLIPAIGVTPFMLCGGIYPLVVLPLGIRWFAYFLPWTHAVALVRYALMGASESGLDQIWGFGSAPVMATLSALCLVAFVAVAWALALRAFRHATTL